MNSISVESKMTIMPIDGSNIMWDGIVDALENEYNTMSVSGLIEACTDCKGNLFIACNQYTHLKLKTITGRDILDNAIQVISEWAGFESDIKTIVRGNRIYFYSTAI